MTLKNVKIIVSIVLVIGLILGMVGVIGWMVVNNGGMGKHTPGSPEYKKQRGDLNRWFVVGVIGMLIFSLGSWLCRKAFRYPQDLEFILIPDNQQNPDKLSIRADGPVQRWLDHRDLESLIARWANDKAAWEDAIGKDFSDFFKED